MNTTTAPAAIAATVTGSKGQVIARFRVKALAVKRYDAVERLPVLGTLKGDATMLVVETYRRGEGDAFYKIYDCNGLPVYGGFQRGSGSIFIQVHLGATERGHIVTREVTHGSAQIQTAAAHFVGMWSPAMEKANEVNRAHRALSGTRTTEERKEIATANRAEKIAKYAGKVERAEKKLATAAANLTKRYDAALRKLTKAGTPLVLNNGVRDIDAVLLEAFGMYSEPGASSLESVIAYELAETAHKLAAYRLGTEPGPFKYQA